MQPTPSSGRGRGPCLGGYWPSVPIARSSSTTTPLQVIYLCLLCIFVGAGYLFQARCAVLHAGPSHASFYPDSQLQVNLKLGVIIIKYNNIRIHIRVVARRRKYLLFSYKLNIIYLDWMRYSLLWLWRRIAMNEILNGFVVLF